MFFFTYNIELKNFDRRDLSFKKYFICFLNKGNKTICIFDQIPNYVLRKRHNDCVCSCVLKQKQFSEEKKTKSDEHSTAFCALVK